MRIQLQSDCDIGLDLNTAEDMDLANLTFAGTEEGDDLADFLAEKVGNYDYLDIDEEDLKTIPSPDIDASAVPEVEKALVDGYQTHARGDGAGNRVTLEHHEHLREQRHARGPDKDVVLTVARKAMMGGLRGDALLHFLAARFDKAHLQAAAKDLRSYTVDQHLLGNVILEPELFESCGKMATFLKDRKVAGTAKLVKTCEDCRGCRYRNASYCHAFGATLVKQMPDSPKVFARYVEMLRDAGKLTDDVVEAVQKKARNHREATAAIFAWAEMAPTLRHEVQSAVPSSGAVPERREVKQTPYEAQVRTVGKLINTGARLNRIKSSILGYLGKTSFERVAREAMTRRGAMPLESFGSCDHPMLMDKRAEFELIPGPPCEGCVNNYGTHCRLNQRHFKQQFVEPSKYTETPELMGEDERFFEGSVPTIDATPSVSSVPALEAFDVEGLDEGFEV